MEQVKRKYVQLGSLWAGPRDITLADGTTVSKNMVSISLGSKSSDPKYVRTVEITVKDGHGNVIHSQTDGYLNLNDPRQFAETEEKRAKIPANLKYNVSVALPKS